jgi:drug/metabolite transporter (DMT)-like permease
VQRLSLTALLLLITAIWGWTFSVVKDAVDQYGSVVGFLAIRFAIGALALGVLAISRTSRRSLLAGIPIGVLLAVAYLLQTFGLHYTTATNCGLITGLFVVFALLTNRVWFGVRTPAVFWAAVLLSILGLVLLTSPWTAMNGQTGSGLTLPTLGDLLTLGCAACFGVQIALLDRFARGHDAIALTFVQLVTAAAVFLAVWPLAGPSGWPTPPVWFALVLTGVVATAAGFYVQVLVQQRLPAVRTGVILSMEPAFAALFGYLAGDRLTAIQMAGGGLMLGAVVLSEMAANLHKGPSTQG